MRASKTKIDARMAARPAAAASSARSGARPCLGPRPKASAAASEPAPSSQAREGSRKKLASGQWRQPTSASARLASAEKADAPEHRPRPPAPEEQQEQREEDVVLLLDREAPGVEQRVVVGRGLEVAGDLQQPEVGDEEDDRDEAAEEVGELVRHHGGERHRHAGGEHDIERRQDPPGPALVEAADGEAALGMLGQQDRGDEEAGDDEEHVDADEAAGDAAEAGMEQDHRDHGNGSQAVDLGTVTHRDGPRTNHSQLQGADAHPRGPILAARRPARQCGAGRVSAGCCLRVNAPQPDRSRRRG